MNKTVNFFVRSAAFMMIGAAFAHDTNSLILGMVGVTVVALTKNFFED